MRIAVAYLLFAVCLSVAAIGSAQQVSVSGPPQLVWSHSKQGCGRGDYSDVPVRPFLNDRNEVVWFAGNSDAYLLTKGMAGADRLARMERVRCTGTILSEPYDRSLGVRPEAYHAGVWLEAPFTADGRLVYALAHDEFHGEWSGDRRYCDEQYPHNRIVLRCGYWNLIAAHSSDGGDSFALSGRRPDGLISPAIALPDPYVFEGADGNSVASPSQGMVAQSNIVQWGSYYYVLVLQQVHSTGGPQPLNGVCIFRSGELSESAAWRGWSGATREYSIEVARSYPTKSASAAEHCTPVLPGYYRFSWSYNIVLGRFIIVGVDPAYQSSRQSAFVYITATLDAMTGELQPQGTEALLMPIAWLPEWQRDANVEGAAYPSLLDAASPELSVSAGPPVVPGDRNFQYSGATPYLYYTRLNPRGANHDSTNRDVVRVPLRVTAR